MKDEDVRMCLGVGWLVQAYAVGCKFFDEDHVLTGFHFNINMLITRQIAWRR